VLRHEKLWEIMRARSTPPHQDVANLIGFDMYVDVTYITVVRWR